jgi:hypothetical protein
MSEQQTYHQFAALVRGMRDLQRAYFRARRERWEADQQQELLKKSKDAEKAVDQWLKGMEELGL